jgi:hypothetical protein
MDNIVPRSDTLKNSRKFFPSLWHGGTCVAYVRRVIINPFRNTVWHVRRKSLGFIVSFNLVRFAAAASIWAFAYYFVAKGNCATSSGGVITENNPIAIPEVGSYGLRVLSPTVLELTLINTKDASASSVSTWNFVDGNFNASLPAASAFTVTANSQNISVSSVSFKRRPIYAPIKERDLRIGNHIYLKLTSSIPDGAAVEVKNPSGSLWNAPVQYATTNDVLRFNPAIHVNEVGYMPSYTKKAMVGYYLGSLGEMDIPTGNGFKIVSTTNGAVVFSGTLRQRADVGYTYNALIPPAQSAPYQKVYEADFSAFTTPGEYRLQVPGMGASYSFMINEGTAATFARTFALGLYHQRCGEELILPYTRHEHGFCHTNPVDIPTMDFAEVQAMLASKVSDLLDPKTHARLADVMPRHTAPPMTNINASLYPFVRQGKIDVSKGHHDAGDYSKYTINSAGLIHHLVFAADSFAGAGALDNMGIPESGDGKSDLLQEAKWEADYLAKMQDTDGGFFFLTYPKAREYENDVTPDHGDPQVVWPKTTAVTAAATAALAEIASSPRFKSQFPFEAALYMTKAQLGWKFLTNAIARFGKDGSYQKITHYGNEFMHDDELAWAAAAMFAATGNATYSAKLMEWFPDPNAVSTRRWDWWRMFEGYGCAIRTYAFAARSGRVPASALNAGYLAQCETEIQATADDHVRFSNQTAYGTSFPDLNKAYRSAGWYFSSERAFDITVAYQINPRADYKEVVFANVNFEAGCNPINVPHITGIGWKRQRDIVHQAALNDRQTLPPSGIPLGNIVPGSPYHWPYDGELTLMTFPADNATTAPYPYYDRWVDSWDTMAEFVVMDEARCLGSLAFWMAQSQVATQTWKSVSTAQITGLPAQLPVDNFATISLTVPGIDLNGAQVVWEAKNVEPSVGSTFTFTPKFSGDTWLEAEALLPDGRRIFVKTNFIATTSLNTPANADQSAPVAVSSDTAAIYHLDNALTDATGKQGALTLAGCAAFDGSNLAWLSNRVGAGLRFSDLGDKASVSIPAASLVTGSAFISVEAMIYITAWKAYNRGNAQLLSLAQNSDSAQLELREDMYAGPMIRGGSSFSYGGAPLKSALTLNTWHHLTIRVDASGYTVKLNGNVIASSTVSGEVSKWSPNGGPITLKVGDFDGWIDEVVVRSSASSSAPNNVPPTVTLASPGSNLIAPASLVLSANASDSDGSIAKVEFFNGGTKLGESTTAPYTFAWPSVAAGTYSLTARATDNSGAITTSGAVTATVASATGGGNTNTNTTGSNVFIKTDTATQGNWRGVFGAEGFLIPGQSQSLPSYSGAAVNGQVYAWADPTSDIRALQKSTGTDHIASVWTATDTFNIDMNFTDAKAHRVTVYVMDWDNMGRAERFEVIDVTSGAVLQSTDVSDFGAGKYLQWDLRGNVRLKVTRTAGNNAIVEGVFFDVAPKTLQAASLKIKGVSLLGLQVELTGDAGTYALQSSTDMTNWGYVGQVTLGALPVTFLDTAVTSLQGLRFYRVAPAN